MNREDFIKFIPKPENKDVILYDISLKDLIDVNVLQEYDIIYPLFAAKKEKYLALKASLDEYQKAIDNIYLLKPSWNEDDYLQNLQDYKKTYSTLFGEIKKLENNIVVLQKKLKGINEKIQIQLAKEAKKINTEKENFNFNMDRTREKFSTYKNIVETYKLSLSQIDSQIALNQEEFENLVAMEAKLKDGTCQCELCGRTIKNTSENSQFYKRLCSNIERNKKQLEKILKQKEKVETNISYYQSEAQKLKTVLDNTLELKKETSNFYQKKSVEILKLEGLRDETINNISQLEKQLKTNSAIKSEQYLDLKDKIEKCELSLNNLNKIKELKKQSELDIQEFNKLKKELKEMINKLDQYIKFINIYYKIIEQKANEYCGDDFKFVFFKIEDYKVIYCFNVIYKGIEYDQLDKKTKDEVDKFLMQKFSIYY